MTHRLPFAPNRGDRIRAYHMLQHLRRHASVDLLSMVHDAAEAGASADVPADSVTIVRTTPWRNRVRSAFLLPTGVPLTHSLLDAPGLASAAADLVRARRPDVILGYCSGIARLALTAPLRTIPLVLDMVDVDSAKWLALSRSTRSPLALVYGREARCLGRFESRIVAHARTTLVVNERERRTLVQAAPGADIRSVPNGIDLDQFRRPDPYPASSESRVVFCGVMNYQPNEEAALSLIESIWPKVQLERPDARLTIVGAHATARLRRAASSDPTIDVTGAVPDVRPYLWRASLSIAPLTTARGVQNKVLEALAAGLPVVITPTVAEGLPAAAMPGCVVAGDSHQAAEAVLTLLRRRERELRDLAKCADLSELGWAQQLAPLVPILTEAVSINSPTRLAS